MSKPSVSWRENPPPGVIEPGALYLAEEARARLKLGDWAWRKMRRNGLRVIRQGRRAFVLGSDLIEYFEKT